MEAYYQSLKSVRLYGPTHFSPVINHVARQVHYNHSQRCGTCRRTHASAMPCNAAKKFPIRSIDFSEFPAMCVGCCMEKQREEMKINVLIAPSSKRTRETTMNSPLGNQSAQCPMSCLQVQEKQQKLNVTTHSRRNSAVNVTPPTISQTLNKRISTDTRRKYKPELHY